MNTVKNVFRKTHTFLPPVSSLYKHQFFIVQKIILDNFQVRSFVKIKWIYV